jgi:hypothetical protein
VGVNAYNGEFDSYYMGTSTNNYSTYERMMVCGYADQGVGAIMRGILKFDISSIPAHTTITSATLSLYSYFPTNTKGSTGFYGVYPLTRDWIDSQVNWNVAKTGVNWTTAGGDFLPTPDATSPKQPPTAMVWYPFDVMARVQSWLNGTSTNYGWVIKCTNENLHNQDYFYQADTANAPYTGRSWWSATCWTQSPATSAATGRSTWSTCSTWWTASAPSAEPTAITILAATSTQTTAST